jgi:DNA polymerase delta subunit 1
MPAATLAPQKRVLGDSTKANRNIPSPSPNSAKKRKLDSDIPATVPRSSQNGPKSKLGSSQPKSQFESEVLEKLTQDISGLKRANSEKDQQWDRPSLDDFNPQRDSLCFQQIEAEEGTIHGGKTTIKLFGVTEVRLLIIPLISKATHMSPDRPFCSPTCYELPTLPLCCCSSVFHSERL